MHLISSAIVGVALDVVGIAPAVVGIAAAVVGVALKFQSDIVLKYGAHQQHGKLLVCANTFFHFITNCLRNTNNGNGDMINRNEMKGAT